MLFNSPGRSKNQMKEKLVSAKEEQKDENENENGYKAPDKFEENKK